MCDTSFTTRERTFTGGSVGSFACYFNNDNNVSGRIPQRVVVRENALQPPPMPVSPDSHGTMASPTNVQDELDYTQKLHRVQLEKDEALDALRHLSEGIRRVTRTLKHRGIYHSPLTSTDEDEHTSRRIGEEPKRMPEQSRPRQLPPLEQASPRCTPPTSPPGTPTPQRDGTSFSSASTVHSHEILQDHNNCGIPPSDLSFWSAGLDHNSSSGGSIFANNTNHELLVALSEASQMVIEHERLAAKEAALLVQDIQSAHQQAQEAQTHAEKAKRLATKLYKKNKSLQCEVDQLTIERKILAQEVKVLRQSHQEETWRLREHHVRMHELQLEVVKQKQQQESLTHEKCHEDGVILDSPNKKDAKHKAPASDTPLQNFDQSAKDFPSHGPQKADTRKDEKEITKEIPCAVPQTSASSTTDESSSTNHLDVAKVVRQSEESTTPRPTATITTLPTHTRKSENIATKMTLRNGLKFGGAIMKQLALAVPDLEDEYSSKPKKKHEKISLSNFPRAESLPPKQQLSVIQMDKNQEHQDQNRTQDALPQEETETVVTLKYRPVKLQCDKPYKGAGASSSGLISFEDQRGLMFPK